MLEGNGGDSMTMAGRRISGPSRSAISSLQAILLTVFFVAVAYLLGDGLTYPLEVLAAAVSLVGILVYYRRSHVPVAFLGAAMINWLGITVAFIYTSFSGVPIEDLLSRPGFTASNIRLAFWYGLLGLTTYLIALQISIPKNGFPRVDSALVGRYDANKLALTYVGFSIITSVAFAWSRYTIPGLAQPLFALAHLKWAILSILVYVLVVQRTSKWLLFLIVFGEVGLGLVSYFSEFKEVLILTPLMYFAVLRRVTRRMIMVLVFAGAVLFSFGSFWSAVKGDYRVFLSGGARAQIVVVDETAALRQLAKLASEMDWEDFERGGRALLARIFSIEYLSATIRNIPANRDHFYGELLGESFAHVLQPRFLFPDKPVIDESLKTQRLTGIAVSGSRTGTQIGSGLLSEGYADFGVAGVVVYGLIFGFLHGQIFRLLCYLVSNPLWVVGLSYSFFFLVQGFSMSAIKLIGNSVMFLAVFMLFSVFALPHLNSILLKQRR